MFERSVPVIDDQAEGWAPSIIDRVLRERESNAQRLEITLDLRSAEQILSSWRDEDVLFYLASRNQSEIVVASGISDQIFLDGERSRKEIVASIAEIEARAEDGARYYGGLRFDPFTDSDEEWRTFDTINFIKPRFEVRIGRGATVLLVNEGSVEDLSQAMDGWSFDDRPCNGRELRLRRGTENPNRADWLKAVESALTEIRHGDVEKLVLARVVDFHSERKIDAVNLLTKLTRTSPSCYHLLFRPEPGAEFVSATPERLLQRRGSKLRSEAVAGTRPRSVSVEDDAKLLDDLLTSDKERREHEVVGRSIIEALSGFSESIDIAREPSEMLLATGRHLKSGVRAELRPGVRSADLIAAVHPTPAVGGYPTDDARSWLRNSEPFDRGWYAGAVGWIGGEEAEIAVGIRSALIRDERLRLYSGAGIVEGSIPEAEWDEIEQKLGGFLKVLRVDGT